MTPDEIEKALVTGAINLIIYRSDHGIGDPGEPPLFEGQCNDEHHTVLVIAYNFGQIRIRITDKRKPDSWAPEGHGSIVRELDSYKKDVAADCISMLMGSDDPMAYAESLAKPWNTSFVGDRIRLDNEPSRYGPVSL